MEQTFEIRKQHPLIDLALLLVSIGLALPIVFWVRNQFDIYYGLKAIGAVIGFLFFIILKLLLRNFLNPKVLVTLSPTAITLCKPGTHEVLKEVFVKDIRAFGIVVTNQNAILTLHNDSGKTIYEFTAENMLGKINTNNVKRLIAAWMQQINISDLSVGETRGKDRRLWFTNTYYQQ